MGCIVFFDEPNRRKKLLELIDQDAEFTDTFSIADLRIASLDVCLMGFGSSQLSYVGIMKVGKRVASYKSHIRFSHIQPIEPLEIDEITGQLGPRFSQHFFRSTSGQGGQIPPKTWAAFMSLLARIYPNAFKVIEQVVKLLNSPRQLNGPRQEILAQEKDAAGLALAISGFNKSKQVLATASIENLGAPFLAGINQAYLIEDQMIAHDGHAFSDWKETFKAQALAMAVFEKNGEKLYVMNVNRHPLERTLGVDLIYYHHVYDSFVLVQYKRMTGSADGFGSIYRPDADRSYKREKENMERFLEKYMRASLISTPQGFRMHEMPFYFKLCNSVSLTPLSSELIRGMYFPLSYWRVLLSSDKVKGPRGGVGVTYENAGRWLSNTEFVQLVQKGWIGSPPSVSKNISAIINERLKQHNSVTVAYSEPTRDF